MRQPSSNNTVANLWPNIAHRLYFRQSILSPNETPIITVADVQSTNCLSTLEADGIPILEGGWFAEKSTAVRTKRNKFGAIDMTCFKTFVNEMCKIDTTNEIFLIQT